MEDETPKLTTVDEAWRDLANAAHINTTSPIQQQEMRRAFYAGVAFTLGQFGRLGAAEVTENTAVTHLKLLESECQMFSVMVGRVPGF